MDWQARGLPPRNHQVLLGLLQRAGTAGGRWPAVACLPLAGVPGLLSMVLHAGYKEQGLPVRGAAGTVRAQCASAVRGCLSRQPAAAGACVLTGQMVYARPM